MTRLQEWIHAVKDWLFALIDQFAASPHPGWWLFALAFAESSFFPIPPDVLLITLGVANPEAAIWYGVVTSVGSVLGGAAGYAIGLYGGRPLLYRFFAAAKIHSVERLYDRFNAWATGIAGLTPIPYKVFTIAGGAFKIDFKIFMLASLVSRSLRFMAEGVLLYFFGEPIKDFLYEQFNWLSIAFVILLVGGFWLIHAMGRRHARRSASEADGGSA
ncbi:MAG TPA: VTT domain-containing protein [Candidatus Sulfomarinibacteraceae bacterium]|nr:VTT domain-containing protein [Candidatus Sulfomarinibacteraceae bacterium]